MNEPANKHAQLDLWRSLQQDLKPNFVKTLDHVEKSGWQTWAVGSGDAHNENFFYTVGVYDTFGLPELITVGLPLNVGGSTLNYAIRLMREGKDLTQGRIPNVLGGAIEVEFQPIDPKWLHRVMLRASWYYEGKDVPALQLIYPDLENRFQWEEGFNNFFKQPMLAPGYPQQDLEKEFWDSHDLDFDKTTWKFSDPPQTRVMTWDTVETGTEPITYAVRYEDGKWLFCGPSMSEQTAVTSRLRRIVASDKSIEELANLPLGWIAERDAPGKPWKRYEDTDGD